MLLIAQCVVSFPSFHLGSTNSEKRAGFKEVCAISIIHEYRLSSNKNVRLSPGISGNSNWRQQCFRSTTSQKSVCETFLASNSDPALMLRQKGSATCFSYRMQVSCFPVFCYSSVFTTYAHYVCVWSCASFSSDDFFLL